MSISDDDVRRVKEATDLAALVGRRVSLKRSGTRHKGLCPFHNEKTPSFYVNNTDGFYNCFGCKASGDAITFVRETEGHSFVEAVEMLAQAANITLHYGTPGAQRQNQRRKELLELLERAAHYYHERLMTGDDARRARAFLRQRGYERETVLRWRIGYAPPEWDALSRHLEAPHKLLVAAGLAKTTPARGAAASPSESGREVVFDFFRDRLMFPICDASGKVVSFAGRVLPQPDDGASEPALRGPKYVNTAGTAVYDKSRVLYGLHMAKQAAKNAERIVVCEGYTDVIGCGLAGVPEAVATCGTSLTRQHAERLSRSTKRVVLAFDADAAGQRAAESVHQWERALGLDVFVAALPQGADPGDLALADPDALRRALDTPQPLRLFRAERILERADLSSPLGRERAASEAAAVFTVYPSEYLHDDDLKPIADQIPIEVATFRRLVDAARERADQRRSAPAPDSYEPPQEGYVTADYEPPEDYPDDLAPSHRPVAGHELGGTDERPNRFDDHRRLLEAVSEAASGTAKPEESEDVKMACLRFAQSTLRGLRSGVDTPLIRADSDDPATEQSVRWLTERRDELKRGSPESRVAAAKVILDWVLAAEAAQTA